MFFFLFCCRLQLSLRTWLWDSNRVEPVVVGAAAVAVVVVVNVTIIVVAAVVDSPIAESKSISARSAAVGAFDKRVRRL